MAYRDLREHLAALDQKGLLHHVHAEVEKEWEISAVARRMFQRRSADQRQALMFHNVKGHDMPVAVGVLGANRAVYATCLGTDEAHIFEVWSKGSNERIPPKKVPTGPVQDIVLLGDAADLTRLPVPTWTVEWDAGPYHTSPLVITQDPDTGINNMGTYRTQVKGPRKMGLMMASGIQDSLRHIKKNEAAGRDTPVCVVIGGEPTLGLCSVAKFPPGVDEYAVVGGLRGSPLEICPAKTQPLYVPAWADIVIEGVVRAGKREMEGPFGEYTGYMGGGGENYFIEVTAITRRKDAIYQAFLSMMPPSESSCIRGIGRDLPTLNHLKNVLRLPVKDLYFTEPGAAAAWLNISIEKAYPGIVQQVAMAAWAFGGTYAKYMVIVDEDIDVKDWFQVQWAMSYRVQPITDIYIFNDVPSVTLDPSTAPYSAPHDDIRRKLASKVLFDATRKHEFPPVALPPKAHLDKVDAQWDKYGFKD